MNKDEICGICNLCHTGVDGYGICDCTRVTSVCPTCGTKQYKEVKYVYGNAGGVEYVSP